MEPLMDGMGEEGVVADQIKAESAVADKVRRSLRSHRQVRVLVLVVQHNGVLKHLVDL